MVSKWIKTDKYWWGFGGHVVLFDKVAFYLGTTDHWGIGIQASFYERSITLDILNLYMGVEIWRSDDGLAEFVARSSGDLMD